MFYDLGIYKLLLIVVFSASISEWKFTLQSAWFSPYEVDRVDGFSHTGVNHVYGL